MRKSEPSAVSVLREALCLDGAGREGAAIPLYRRAVARGLSRRNLRTALICLGSSLRTVGDVKAAVRTLQRARSLFPRDPTITLFLALAHHDAGQVKLAIRQLADMLLKESRSRELAPYRAVLSHKFHALR